MDNPFKNAKVGDYIKFGSYPQTADAQEQPIEWQVLARENNKVLVISRCGIETMRFDRRSNNWKKSEICQWLNNEFYNRAFIEQDKKYIQPFNGDNVFLLTKEEAEKYFANDDELIKCKATEYAIKNGAYLYNGYSWWWLRSPYPNFSNYVYFVINDGFIFDYCNVCNSDFVVRPTLRINI